MTKTLQASLFDAPFLNGGMKPGKTGIKRIIDAFGYSCAGFAEAFKSEAAFRQELLLCVILFPFAIFLQFSAVERVLLITSLMLILLMELVNSGIEAVVDRISDEKHHLSKKAKDIGSLAVLLAIINALITWAILLGGYFLG